MILLLYGPDTYRSRRKLNEIIDEYRKKAGSGFYPHTQADGSPHGQESPKANSNLPQTVSSSLSVGVNLHWIDAEEEDPQALKALCDTRSLFPSKKLVVVKRLFSSGKDTGIFFELATRIKESEDTVVIVWDEALSALSKQEFARLEKIASKIQEFKLLQGEDLNKWIRYEAGIRKVALSPADILCFASYGSDLWKITNELEKVMLTGGAVGAGGVSQDPTVFQLGDSFFTSKRDALHTLHRLIDAGQDEFGLFSYLANYIRTLYTVKFYSERNRPVPSSQGIHPFVAKKAGALARSFSLEHFQKLLTQFFEEDVKIKIGLSRPKDSLVHILFRGNEQKG